MSDITPTSPSKKQIQFAFTQRVKKFAEEHPDIMISIGQNFQQMLNEREERSRKWREENPGVPPPVDLPLPREELREQMGYQNRNVLHDLHELYKPNRFSQIMFGIVDGVENTLEGVARGFATGLGTTWSTLNIASEFQTQRELQSELDTGQIEEQFVQGTQAAIEVLDMQVQENMQKIREANYELAEWGQGVNPIARFAAFIGESIVPLTPSWASLKALKGIAPIKKFVKNKVYEWILFNKPYILEKALPAVAYRAAALGAGTVADMMAMEGAYRITKALEADEWDENVGQNVLTHSLYAGLIGAAWPFGKYFVKALGRSVMRHMESFIVKYREDKIANEFEKKGVVFSEDMTVDTSSYSKTGHIAIVRKGEIMFYRKNPIQFLDKDISKYEIQSITDEASGTTYKTYTQKKTEEGLADKPAEVPDYIGIEREGKTTFHELDLNKTVETGRFLNYWNERDILKIKISEAEAKKKPMLESFAPELQTSQDEAKRLGIEAKAAGKHKREIERKINQIQKEREKNDAKVDKELENKKTQLQKINIKIEGDFDENGNIVKDGAVQRIEKIRDEEMHKWERQMAIEDKIVLSDKEGIQTKINVLHENLKKDKQEIIDLTFSKEELETKRDKITSENVKETVAMRTTRDASKKIEKKISSLQKETEEIKPKIEKLEVKRDKITVENVPVTREMLAARTTRKAVEVEYKKEMQQVNEDRKSIAARKADISKSPIKRWLRKGSEKGAETMEEYEKRKASWMEGRKLKLKMYEDMEKALDKRVEVLEAKLAASKTAESDAAKKAVENKKKPIQNEIDALKKKEVNNEKEIKTLNEKKEGAEKKVENAIETAINKEKKPFQNQINAIQRKLDKRNAAIEERKETTRTKVEELINEEQELKPRETPELRRAIRAVDNASKKRQKEKEKLEQLRAEESAKAEEIKQYTATMDAEKASYLADDLGAADNELKSVDAELIEIAKRHMRTEESVAYYKAHKDNVLEVINDLKQQLKDLEEWYAQIKQDPEMMAEMIDQSKMAKVVIESTQSNLSCSAPTRDTSSWWWKIFAFSPRDKGLLSNFKDVRRATEAVFGTYTKSEFNFGSAYEDYYLARQGDLINVELENKASIEAYCLASKLPAKEARAEFFEQLMEANRTNVTPIDHHVNAVFERTKKLVRDIADEAFKFPDLYSEARIAEVREGWRKGKGYVHRVYNRKYIEENYDEVRASIIAGFRDKGQNLAQAEIAADGALNHIMNGAEVDMIMQGITIKNSGPLLEDMWRRTLDIDDFFVMKFIEKDPEIWLRHYVDGHSMQIALARCNEKLGVKCWEDYVKQFEATHKKMGETLRGRRELNRAIRILNDMPLIVTGAYMRQANREFWGTLGPGRCLEAAINALKGMNDIRLLGGIPFTIVDDMAPLIMNSDAGIILHQLISGFEKQLNVLSKEDLIGMHMGVDGILNNMRYVADTTPLVDIADNAVRAVRNTNNVVRAVSSTVYKYVGMPTLDKMMEHFLSQVFAKKLLAELESSKPAIGNLTTDATAAIRLQIAKFSRNIDDVGNRSLNLGRWTDSNARVNFEAQVRRLVRRAHPRAELGAIPKLYQHPAMKLFDMFYSYSFAMQSQVLMPLLYEGKYGQFVTMQVLGLGLGALKHVLKCLILGKALDLATDEGQHRLWRVAVNALPLGQFSMFSDEVYQAATGEWKVKYSGQLIRDVLRGGALRSGIDMYDSMASLWRKKNFDSDDWGRFVKGMFGTNIWYLDAALNWGKRATLRA